MRHARTFVRLIGLFGVCALTGLASMPATAGGYSIELDGSSLSVPSDDPNNAVWMLNMDDSVQGEVSFFRTRIDHDGILTTPVDSPGVALDHLALVTRGGSFERLFEELNKPGAAFHKGYGEFIETHASSAAISDAIAGRAVTIWAPGAGPCLDKSRPCVLFENVSLGSLICGNVDAQGNRVNCPYAIPVNLGSGSVRIQMSVADTNIDFSLRQNGVEKASGGCNATTGYDWRCRRQTADKALGDAFIAWLVQDNSAGSSRQVTIYDTQSQVLSLPRF